MQTHFPKLLIDEAKARSNIRSMVDKAKRNHVIFRPHFKTHQSSIIGSWFHDEGVQSITVSSLSMARYFIENEWKDIFVAFPVNILEIAEINRLAKIIQLSVSVESADVALFLSKHITDDLGIYIKVDTGYHRTGIDPDNKKGISRILDIIKQSDSLKFIGFYTHAGHTYQSKGKNEIQKIYNDSSDILNALGDEFRTAFPELILSVGDTPSCSIIENFGSVDEIRPGNFVFFDLMQRSLEACSVEDICVALECPVVAIHPERSEIVIHGGAVHLSKECILFQDRNIYGLVSPVLPNGWDPPVPNTYVKGLSQEHGIIKTDEKFLSATKIGDTLAILPVHSCLTANLANYYYNFEGKEISKTRS